MKVQHISSLHLVCNNKYLFQTWYTSHLVSPFLLPTSVSGLWPCAGLSFCNDYTQPLLTLSWHDLVQLYIDLICSRSERERI